MLIDLYFGTTRYNSGSVSTIFRESGCLRLLDFEIAKTQSHRNVFRFNNRLWGELNGHWSILLQKVGEDSVRSCIFVISLNILQKKLSNCRWYETQLSKTCLSYCIEEYL